MRRLALLSLLLLAGCGGSGLCDRWDVRAGADLAAAQRVAQGQSQQFSGIVPQAQLSAQARQIGAASYRLFITRDLHSRAWRAAAKCSTPAFH